ncbi:3-hydroxyacyl-CoA dehydrogenase NAD-binding domain-containing protein [Desulforhabdus amnigena]|uniref:3-hydroxyacyl-CoA dehydrogenase n=1 Tax=Desulforhabdus amnigena TaxID=40218 RepID=A0A9W6FRL7_9BACT|nr:3-hydroxyacyl-CoA dehydrogenase NAD-binding domain-containing protein [Desulforhabdus amnigena]NLJ28858.1 3-hydroxyacyl-CoA dehydrogenase [Deltaproteobacteria bacterium]GLI33124.1 3-hydroxyacyl-CoA dehydrogenase [Desulforhabdus amnigena]
MAEPVTRFYNRFYDSPVGKIAIVTMDNGHDYKKPNTFSEVALQSLNEALDQILAVGDVKGMMLTGKPYIFAAGADLTEVPFITTFEQGYRIGKFGHTVMKRIRDLPFPTLAAINGVALGGGLEITLYCRYRTVARSVQAIGFPECFLGLIPGWGGCTLATKLLGPDKSLELIVFNALNQNRMIGGAKAYEMGLADRIFDGAEFLDESLRFLLGIVSGNALVERPAVEMANVKELVGKAREFVESKVHGAAPAPYRALELIEGACRWDVERGFEEENKALGDLIKSKQCKASIYSFDLVNRYAKKPAGIPEAEPKPVNKVGIIGAGLMASQLAQLFIYRLGVPVVMKDVKQELVDKGCAHVRNEFRKMVEKGRLSDGKASYLSGLLKGTPDYADFADCDFVIEAVFEQMEIKKQVFAEAEAAIRPDAILASNTSSLSVTRMASDLKHPERVIGFHFFNPVAVLPLVEIIKTQKSDEVTLATAFDLAKKLRKTGILVKDSPAFLVNRILTRMLVDCLALVDEGAGFRHVDDALLALGLPMAPFELLSLVGLPVALHVMETLSRAFGAERFPVNENFKRVVAAKKGGIYIREGKSSRVDPEVEQMWVKAGEKKFYPEEIRERVLYGLARETDLILNEKVVGGSKDVDLAMILGAGWPFFMGGLTMYLDLEGITPKVLQKVFFSF